MPGPWEGDLIFGKDCKSTAGALAGPATRYVLLLRAPADLARTITWDRGKEMACYAGLHHRHLHAGRLLRHRTALADPGW